MDTAKLSYLVAAVEAGSLSVAAKRLGAQLSTVSRSVADVEKMVGAQLLLRTGRGVRPTPAGEAFISRAQRILQEVESATAEARGANTPALSRLKLSAPLDLSMHLLPGCIAALLQKYPKLSIEAHTDSRKVSLVEEEYDAAVRLGPPKDPNLIARSIGTLSLMVCARPAIAASVRSIRDLAQKEFVLISGVPNHNRVHYRGCEILLQFKGSCRVSTFFEAAEVAARSDRFVVLSSISAQPHLSNKRLSRVLPKLMLPKVEVSLVQTPQTRGAKVLLDLAQLLTDAISQIEGQPKRTHR